MLGYIDVVSSTPIDDITLGGILDEGDSVILFSRLFSEETKIEEIYLEDGKIMFDVKCQHEPVSECYTLGKTTYESDIHRKNSLYQISFNKLEGMC